MSCNISNTTTINSIYAQAANEKRKKDEEKQLEMLSGLLFILKDVINVVATSESGDPEIATQELNNDSTKLREILNKDEVSSKPAYCLSSTSSTSKNDKTSTSNDPDILDDYPSTKEISEALVAMNIMIKDLQEQMRLSTDEQYKNACEIMITEMKAAEQVLKDYNQAYNYVEKEWKKYNNYIDQNMNQYEEWMDHTITEYNYENFYIPETVDDPLIKNVENDIEKYCKKEFGIDIYLDPNCDDLDKIIKSANDQVYDYLMSILDVAEAEVETAFIYSTSPVMQEIGRMIFTDAEFNEDAIKALENIVTETLDAISIMSSVSTNDYTSGPSNELVTAILSIMTNTVSNLEAMIAKYEGQQTQDNTDISKKYADASNISLQKAVDQLNYIEKLIHEMDQDDEISKIMGYVTAGLMIVLGAATGNFELVAMAALMLAVQESGADKMLKDALTESFTKILVDSGVSKEQAKMDAAIIADVAVILIIAVACYGMCSGVSMLRNAQAVASESEASTSEAKSMSAEAAPAAETSSTTELETYSNMIYSALRSLYSSLPELSTAGQLSITAGLQEVIATHLASDVTTATLSAYTNLSDHEIQKRAMIAEIIVDIAVSFITLGICSSSTASKATASTSESTFSRLVKNNIVLLSRLYTGISLGASAVETGAAVDKSINLEKQAKAERDLGKDEADLTFFLGLQEMSNTNNQANMQEYCQTLATRQKIDSNMLQSMLCYQAEYVKVLNQSA
ncbi:MAG: hypothetical protein FJZ57_04205 [Chlamydiae bacterium]|nr:hypothetical protein [Chlamydiota bacterium]